MGDALWNMPDYVTIYHEDQILICTLCEAKSNAIHPMYMHLNGDKHAKKCRHSDEDEIIWVKERDRMEVLATGCPVVRTGYTLPRKEKSAADVDVDDNLLPTRGEAPVAATPTVIDTLVDDVQATCEVSMDSPRVVEEIAADDGAKPLPPGWSEYFDESNGCYYYHCAVQGITQWERPVMNAEVLTEPEEPAEDLASTAATEEDTKAVAENPAAEGITSFEVDANSAELPPGWCAVCCEGGPGKGMYYYADEQKHISQWERPNHPESRWTRDVDTSDRAFWLCDDGKRWFYEVDPSSGWERLVDRSGRVWWSHSDRDERFWEASAPGAATLASTASAA